MSDDNLKNITDQDWRERLDDHAFHVTREKGTEPPFENAYHNFKGDGDYRCICCDMSLFDSRHKFDSGSGWPSFFQPIREDIIDEKKDRSIFFMPRTEVLCHFCDAHLGHVFNDGPTPTGLRYCINSAALKFVARHSD